MQDKNLGERENVLVIQNPYTIKDNAEAFKKALLKNEQIVSVSYSSTPLSGVYSQYSHALPNIDRNKEYWLINVLGDHDFFKTLGLNIIEGRNFSSDNPDDTYSVLINESALKTMDIKDPINKKIRGNPWSDKRKEFYTIIGVFEDFHNVSLRSNIDKMIVYSIEDLMHQAYAVLVKLKNAENPEAITYVKDVWSNFAGGKKFNGYLLKDKVESIYSEEKATQQVFKMFSFLSLAIAGLGLYGLALFLLSQREKEMGIRKTLGASMKTLRIQLSRRFIMWVFFATLLAWPLSYLLITNWLNNFAYHVQPNFLDFIISFLLVSLMVFLVVLYQVVKTSKVNPAQALKDE
jgi:putative ABC transport system permease protein